MSLSSIQLDAFVAVARELSFSKAANKLYLTQSALSQRIKHLEDELNLTLFIRNASGLVLTETGERLLRYCQIKDRLEEDFMTDLRGDKDGELAGVLRIAGFSSVMRSVVVPTLSPLLRDHPRVKAQFMVREMHELPEMLTRSEADFIVTDNRISSTHIETKTLGIEKYVVIESSIHKSPSDIYLDNDENDKTTENFFKATVDKPPVYRKSYMGDMYGILDGVAQGLGRAIMSEHLLHKGLPVKVVKQFKAFTFEVFLHFHIQPFYPKLHEEIVGRLVSDSPKCFSRPLSPYKKL